MTDAGFEKLLKQKLSTVLPNVYELVYAGDEVEKFISFSYYSRGVYFANDTPTAKSWFVNVTLWVKKGVAVAKTREHLKNTIIEMGGTYPRCETATDDEWKQFIYEFEYVGGVD